MRGPNLAVEPSSGGPDAELLVEYHRWSCDVLLGQFDAQIQRRRALDAKAAQIVAAIAAVLLWSVTSLEKGASGWLLLGLWASFLVQGVCAGFAACRAFTALCVTASNYPNPRALLIDDDKEVPLAARWRGVRDHLVSTEQDARKEASSKALLMGKAEFWAMWAIPAGVVAALLARIAVMCS